MDPEGGVGVVVGGDAASAASAAAGMTRNCRPCHRASGARAASGPRAAGGGGAAHRPHTSAERASTSPVRRGLRRDPCSPSQASRALAASAIDSQSLLPSPGRGGVRQRSDSDFESSRSRRRPRLGPGLAHTIDGAAGGR